MELEGHLLGGPALGDRAALAKASAQRQMAIATLIAAINSPAEVTIDVIVIYHIITILVTIPPSSRKSTRNLLPSNRQISHLTK